MHKHVYKFKLIIIIIVFILTCFLLFSFQIKFGSINIPRIIYATINVNTSENNYFIIKNDNSNKDASKGKGNCKEIFFASPKKVIIATPNNNYNFNDYVEAMGYDVIEQFGSQVIIGKEGKEEVVYIETNQYYSLWQWY